MVATTSERARPGLATLFLFAWWLATVMWWLLAFLPLPAPPAWLETARSACFGSTPTGLPDADGWTRLVAGPLAILGFLVVVWGGDLRRELRGLWDRGWGRTLLVGVLALTVAGLAGVGLRVQRASHLAEAWQPPPGEPLPEGYPSLDRPLPPFRFVDQTGAELDLAALAGRAWVVTYAYGHCSTVCPVIVHTAAEAVRHLQRRGRPVGLVVVTLDPWRDRPGRLGHVLHHWRLEGIETVHLFSGEVTAVETWLDALEIQRRRDPRTGEISHAAVVHVVDARGRIRYAFLNPPVRWVVEAAERVLTAGPAS